MEQACYTVRYTAVCALHSYYLQLGRDLCALEYNAKLNFPKWGRLQSVAGVPPGDTLGECTAT